MYPFRPSRRRFLRSAPLGAIAALGSNGVMQENSVAAQTPQNPDAALRELIAGNQRFAAGRITAYEHDFTALKRQTVDKQEPFATILSCSDSRVPLELVFDQTIGHIFVCRVAGNIVTPEMIASIEFSVAVLGVKAILVMGHVGCGAVKAAMEGKSVPGQISALFPHIQPAIEQAGGNFDAAIKANARFQAGLLRTASTVVSESVRNNKVKVTAACYDLATGKVGLLD